MAGVREKKSKKISEKEQTAMFFGALSKLAEEKGLDEEDVLVCLETAIAKACSGSVDEDRRHYWDAPKEQKPKINMCAEIDRETGKIYLSTIKTVVEVVENPEEEVSLEEARQYDPEFIVGDEYLTDVTPTSFELLGHTVNAQIKQQFMMLVTEKEKEQISKDCENSLNQICNCEVQSVETSEIYDKRTGEKRKKRKIFVIYNKKEGILSDGDILQSDKYSYGSICKAVLVAVPKGDSNANDSGEAKLLKFSRTTDTFLRRLLEQEVPEIRDGIIEVKGVARKPGKRSKVAVWSNDPTIDPISACVGNGGARIQAISVELGEEKIDVVKWSEDDVEFVANALSPAKVQHSQIVIEDDYEKTERAGRNAKVGKVARVTLPDNDLTLAIGKSGINVALAATLCRCRIDINGTGASSAKIEQDRAELFNIMGD